MIYGLFIGGPVRSFFEFHYSGDRRTVGSPSVIQRGAVALSCSLHYVQRNFNIFAAWASETGPVGFVFRVYLEILRLIYNFVARVVLKG